MNYKGYTGSVSYDDEGEIFHGEVLGIRAVVTFQGKSVDELKKSFRDSVDDYLDWCAQRNKEPEKPFSGKFLVRIDPTIHRQLTTVAATRGVSLNKLVVENLTQAVAV
jgi:predicted HicB family RNase H-like nuclease